MEDGKSSPCLLHPIFKRRKVSAIRDFPKGLKQLACVVDLKSRDGQACGSQNEYLKAPGLHQFREECSVVDSEEKGVHQSSSKRTCDVAVAEVIRDYPKNLKRFPKDIEPKLKRDESCGSENMKELKRYSEEVDPKAKGDEACRSKNPKQFKGSSEELDMNVKGNQICRSKNESLKRIELNETSIEYEREVLCSKRKCDVAVAEVIRDYPKKLKRFPKDIDPKLKWDESYGSENIKELKRYSEEVDPKAKGDEACRSKNPKQFKGSSEELDMNVKENQICRSKNESLKRIELNETSIEYEREVHYEEGVNQFGTEQQCGNGDKNKVFASEKKALYQNFGDISSSDVTNSVKSLREEQKPDSEQDINHCSCLEQQCACDNGNVLRSKESPKCQDNGSPFNSCNLAGVNGNMHRTLPKRWKVSAVRDFPQALVRVIFNPIASSKELLVDNVASTNHLGMDEGSPSNSEIMIEPEYGINDVGIDGQSSLPDEPSLNMEKQEFYHPNGLSSAAINDFQESACQLFGPDDMFHLAPADEANFFSEHCYNGFLFEDVDSSKAGG